MVDIRVPNEFHTRLFNETKTDECGKTIVCKIMKIYLG